MPTSTNTTSRNLFNLCFSKLIMRRPPNNHSSNSSPSTPSSSSKDHHTPTTTTTSTSTSTSPTTTSSSSSSSSSSSDDPDPIGTALCLPDAVDFAAVFSSQRFFSSIPGRSNSIFDSPENDTMVAGAVPFQTFSPDPYLDFRRSMQEMVEARDLLDVRGNWEGLHELLSSYLHLNPKHIHKFIIPAFADLLLALATSSSTSSTGGGRRPEYCSDGVRSHRNWFR